MNRAVSRISTESVIDKARHRSSSRRGSGRISTNQDRKHAHGKRDVAAPQGELQLRQRLIEAGQGDHQAARSPAGGGTG